MTDRRLATLGARVAAALNGNSPEQKLGDFTMSPRVIVIAGLAAVIGAASAYVALALLRLIGLFMNLCFYLRWNTDVVSLGDHRIGPFVLVVPVLGGLVIGVMARYGSERIRGHGIPEAIEAILINGSRVQARVAILKPVSSAISIGTGGPFGAEGPIIMTGGALGSLVAQFFHLTNSERKTLLVAGAAGGMSATFGTPVAAVLLAVELLLFEWKPRSLVPVGIASAVAATIRHYILGPVPIFPVPAHSDFLGPAGLLACCLVGISAGLLSAGLTAAVYASEDAFHRLPIHWMWWPAIGGVVIGLGGLAFPDALGVGYPTINQMLQGAATWHTIIGVLVVKTSIWAISLGSGTSGGVLAPLLMIGGAMGAMEASFLPGEGAGFWPLVAMAAILGGTMRSPLTGLVFALELTHDVNSLPALLVAVLFAHGFTVLVMRRSILTEKVSRRGLHLGREYSVDPLELGFARDVMRTNVVAFPESVLVEGLTGLNADHRGGRQRLYPVVDAAGSLAGVLTAKQLDDALKAGTTGELLKEALERQPVVAYEDEPLRVVAYRMAETGKTVLPVVSRGDDRRLVGLISPNELLLGRTRALDDERQRQRPLRVRLVGSRRPPAEVGA